MFMDTCSGPRRNRLEECLPPQRSFHSFDEIVEHYIENHRERAKKELKRFANLPDLAEAIRVGALAINAHGKRHSHQRRIPLEMLEHFRQGLIRRRADLKACTTFAQLMSISEKIATDIWTHPGLTVYDTTQRIGAHLGIFPDRIYLHTGTAVGAKALGFKNASYLERKQLPKAFQRLEPYEIEDCLCIYKKDLQKLRI